MKRESLLMVSLEALKPGSASSTHFNAIKHGLESAGQRVLEVAQTKSSGSRPLEMLATLAAILGHGLLSQTVYSRWHVLDVATLTLANIPGKTVVLEVNGTTDDILIAHPRLAPAAPLIRRLAQLQFRTATSIIVVSPGLAEWVRELAPESVVRVAPNGADVNIVRERRDPESPPYAAFIGELASWQGLETVLMARDKPEWPNDVRLVIVGDGSMSPEVEEAAKAGKIDYLGRLPHSEALFVMAGANVTLSPQSFHVARNHLMGRPLKISESLILGVPCIGTNFPDTEMVLSGLPGCATIKDDDPVQLALAVGASLGVTTTERDSIATEGARRCSWTQAIEAALAAIYESKS